MVLQVRTTADLFDSPGTDAKILKTIGANQDIKLRENSRSADGNWIDVDALFPNPIPHCFVRAADVVEETNPQPLPVDLWSFVQFCTVASATFNQRQASTSAGVSRDYILALALVLNGLEEKGFPGDTEANKEKILQDDPLQAFDPFRFTEAEWKEFCDTGGSARSYQSFDRFDPLAQIDAAIFFTFRSTSEIDRTFTKPGAGGDPYIPNSMQLFLVHMLGAAGLLALKGRTGKSGVGAKSWESFVNAAGGNVAALKKRYPRFLAARGVATVAEVLGLIEAAFDTAYVKVSEIVPDAQPRDLQQPQDGDPSWLKIARREEAKNVKEPDRRILEYFKATDFGPKATPATAWCGAFAAFCIKNSGNPVPRGSARAANWANWGEQLSAGSPADKVPLGAVVVLSPSPGTGSSGHVAFFVGSDEKDQKKVKLLGGNQSDALNVKSFKRSVVREIRWPPDSEEPSRPAGGSAGTSSAAGVIAIGPFTAEDWEKFCTVLGKRESNNNYRVVNRLGFSGRWQFGAAALVDVGYVRTGCPQRKLGDPGFWSGKDNIFSRSHWLDNQPVQDAAMLDYTRMQHKRLVKMAVIKPGDGKPRIAGLLAAAHLVGCGGARDFANNVIRHDANGTTSKEYFNLLSREFS